MTDRQECLAAQGLPPNVLVLSSLPTDHEGYRITDAGVMRALSAAEDRHFWHRARNRYIARRLAALAIEPPASILDLGCGGGAVSAYLSAHGYNVTGVDGHLPRIVEAATRAPRARFLVHDMTKGLGPLSDEHWDAVGLFDVIEHLGDPAPLLSAAMDLVKPGGALVGTVPALMSLWSAVDEYSGHQRRYDRQTLVAQLRLVLEGAEPEVLPMNLVLVPFLLLRRLWLSRTADPARATRDHVTVPPGPLNALFYALVRLEQTAQPLLDLFPLPAATLWFSISRARSGCR